MSDMYYDQREDLARLRADEEDKHASISAGVRNPAPARLSAEMLGEEDRNYLQIITMIADIHQPSNCDASRRAIAWADRLLGDGKGGA